MNDARTAMGRVRIGISAERKWKRKMMMTKLTMMASSIRSRCSVSMDCVDQPGAVVRRNDLHARRQRRANLRQLLLHAVDDIQRVHAVAHHHDAADGFAFALPIGDAARACPGRSVTVPRSRTSTGVPFLVATGTFSRSLSDMRR